MLINLRGSTYPSTKEMASISVVRSYGDRKLLYVTTYTVLRTALGDCVPPYRNRSLWRLGFGVDVLVLLSRAIIDKIHALDLDEFLA